MAVKVLNKSKAICDVSTFEGGSVILLPGHALVLPDNVSEEVVNYYKAYEKIGLKVVREVPVVNEPVKEEPKKESEEVAPSEDVPEETTEEQIETGYSERDLSKKTKSQLVAIAEELGIEGLESMSKSQIIDRILNG